MNPKVEKLRSNYIKTILSDQQEKLTDIEISALEADNIIQKMVTDFQIPIAHIREMNVDLSTYGKEVELTCFPNKRTFDCAIMVLVDLYGEGKRDRTYNDMIRYSWIKNPEEDRREQISIVVKASTELTGCKLTTVKKMIPERIIEAHEEEVTEIACEPQVIPSKEPPQEDIPLLQEEAELPKNLDKLAPLFN